MSIKLKEEVMLSHVETSAADHNEKGTISPTPSEEFRKQSEQELLDRLMRSWTTSKRHNETLKAKACHQRRCSVVDELAHTWLLENEFISPEVQVFLLSEILPTLILALEKLLMLVEKNSLMDKTERDRNFNPINCLAQFLMRNNPRYCNFVEASPYIRGLRLVSEQMKMRLLGLSSSRVKGLYEVKAEMRQKIQEKELNDQIESTELRQRLQRLSEQFFEWNNGNKVELAVIQNVLVTFKPIMRQMLMRDQSSSATKQINLYENMLQPTDNTGKCVFQSSFVEYLKPYLSAMNEIVFEEFMREMSFYGKLYRRNFIAAGRREQLRELFRSCDVNRSGVMSRHHLLKVLQDFYDHLQKAFRNRLRNPRKWPIMDTVDISAYLTDEQYWSETDQRLVPRSLPIDDNAEHAEKEEESRESSEDEIDADDEAEEENKEIEDGNLDENGVRNDEEVKEELKEENTESITRESKISDGSKSAGESEFDAAAEKISELVGAIGAASESLKDPGSALLEGAEEEEQQQQELEDLEQKREREMMEREAAKRAAKLAAKQRAKEEKKLKKIQLKLAEELLIKNVLEGIPEEPFKKYAHVKAATVGRGMISTSANISDFKKINLPLISNDVDKHSMTFSQSLFSRDIVDVNRFIQILETFLAGVMTADDDFKKPADTKQDSDSTEQTKTNLAMHGLDSVIIENKLETGNQLTKSGPKKNKNEEKDEEQEWIPQKNSIFHQMITYFRELYGDENDKHIADYAKSAEDQKTIELLNVAYRAWNKDLSGYVRFSQLEEFIRAYKSMHIKLTEARMAEILRSAKQLLDSGVQLDAATGRLSKTQFFEYVHNVSRLSAGLIPIDLLAKHIASYTTPVRGASAHVKEARMKTRQRWLSNIKATGFLSRGNIEPLYRTVFYILQKDIRLHSEARAVSMTLALVVRNTGSRYAINGGEDEGESEGEGEGEVSPRTVEDRGPLALKYVAASPEHAKHVLGKTLFRNMKGVSFTALETGKPIYIERVSAHTSIHFWDVRKREKNIDGSFLVIPLVDHDSRSFGVLSMDTLRPLRKGRQSRTSKAIRYQSISSEFPLSARLTDTSATESFDNMNGRLSTSKSLMDYLDGRFPAFSADDIHFYEGVTRAFSASYHMIIEQQRVIDICERAIGWLHEHCSRIKVSKLYLIEPDKDHKSQFNLVLLMTGEAFSQGPVRHAEASLLNRVDDKFSAYIFRCADSAEVVIEEVNREVHVVVPLRNPQGRAALILDLNLGLDEALTMPSVADYQAISLTTDKQLLGHENTEEMMKTLENMDVGTDEEDREANEKEDEEEENYDDVPDGENNDSEGNEAELVDKEHVEEKVTNEDEDEEQDETEDDKEELEIEQEVEKEIDIALLSEIPEAVRIDKHVKQQVNHLMKLVEAAYVEIQNDMLLGRRTKFVAADVSSDEEHLSCLFDRLMLIESRKLIHSLDPQIYERLLGPLPDHSHHDTARMHPVIAAAHPPQSSQVPQDERVWLVMRSVLIVIYPELINTGQLSQLESCRHIFNESLTREILLFDPTREDRQDITAVEIVTRDLHTVTAEQVNSFSVHELRYFYDWLCAVLSLIELSQRESTRPNSSSPT